ncbi:MAG: glycoside hydrolase family 125 protein [Clostridia bacterium]|nr:glycoside hydrolase family 125 protein [Clostridia bacterium]
MYQVTGNEYVSLPQIDTDNGAVQNLTFLYMQAKGMLEIFGGKALIRPYFTVDGEPVSGRISWDRKYYWIPAMTVADAHARFTCTYLTPPGERGFVLRLTAENITGSVLSVRIGADGDWAGTNHRVNESLPMDTGRFVKESGWNHMFVFQQKQLLPLFAFAPIVSDNQPFSEIDQGADWKTDGFSYDIGKSVLLRPGEKTALDICFGIGYEEVAACTSAKEMLRQGYDVLLRRSENWLARRVRRLSSPRLEETLNTNLFFCFFFASGRTVDTEELCMVTSRSPRYYVSAAYWDRDSLLWAFPAILQTDPVYAGELLRSVFHRQSRNFGIHSRFIDGTVLEPGFELDELCAPVIALDRYIQKTGDSGILSDPEVSGAVSRILLSLENVKHPSRDLYATFLQPTDDLRNYPYLTYDNVLVWYVFSRLSVLLGREDLKEKAGRVRGAVYGDCVINGPDGPMFAWSTDLNGHSDIYDEPPGSLQLLPFYGFCDPEDPVWRNTVAHIRSETYALSFAGHRIAEIGCKHAPHPWILSVCNSLLCGYGEKAKEHLEHTVMDNGIACESVHEDTGICTTGAAFATCAGFLAYALLTADSTH